MIKNNYRIFLIALSVLYLAGRIFISSHFSLKPEHRITFKGVLNSAVTSKLSALIDADLLDDKLKPVHLPFSNINPSVEHDTFYMHFISNLLVADKSYSGIYADPPLMRS